jgi:carbon monoxide dehydrogenase subunit G
MKLEQSFEVEAPLERVWEALVDVERVAPCLPGAALTGRNDDGTYNGTFTIKIGPTTASYTGKLEMQDVDEGAHSATMHAQGSDKRGQGGATATIASTLSSAGGGTKVEVVTDYHITGRLARFGRGGMIEDISERLLREFASRLQSSLAGGGSAGDAREEAPTAVHAVVGQEDEPDTPPPTEVATPAEEPSAARPEDPSPPEAEAPAHSAADEAPLPSPAEAADEAPPPPAPPAAEAEPGPEPAPPAAAELEPAAVTEPAPPVELTPPPPPPPPAANAPPPPPPAPPGREEAPPPPPRPRPQPVEPNEPNEPLDAGSLVGSVMVDRVRRNPKPVIALVGGLLLLRLLRRRR